MQKLSIQQFKHTKAYIFLSTLVSIIISAISLVIIVTILATDTRLNRMCISEYHLIIAFGLTGFIIEVFLNKRRRKKEEALLSTMTEEECEKYKKESSERFKVRLWYEPTCYIICAFLTKIILTLFNFD